MLRNKLFAIIVSLINLMIVLSIIAFISDNPFVNIMLGVYVIAFSSMMSFLSRRRD